MKISKEQRGKIVRLKAMGISLNALSQRFGVPKNTISYHLRLARRADERLQILSK